MVYSKGIHTRNALDYWPDRICNLTFVGPKTAGSDFLLCSLYNDASDGSYLHLYDFAGDGNSTYMYLYALYGTPPGSFQVQGRRLNSNPQATAGQLWYSDYGGTAYSGTIRRMLQNVSFSPAIFQYPFAIVQPGWSLIFAQDSKSVSIIVCIDYLMVAGMRGAVR